MHERREKPIAARDAERASPNPGTQPPQEAETHCGEEHDFDIVFEFERHPHGPN